eukprot:TRINITY_DN23456_c0_g1_i1.p1 TRINITY_DN23456_c0_g1~~TRINITY_DN23456_c0_g1_i1.p1  ORF type:complete len:124 (-),score=25.49 TRINITY_DN23456_c0_g1_i1:77-448(-)
MKYITKSGRVLEQFPKFRLDKLIEDVAPIHGPTTPYSTYMGSLTTPTCNEAVHWINFLTPLKISSRQLEVFRTLLDGHDRPIVDNYRPPQPLNGRKVIFYTSGSGLDEVFLQGNPGCRPGVCG